MTEEGKTAESTNAPAGASADLKAEIEKLPLTEKVISPIALLVVVGWIIRWSSTGYFDLFKAWFATLSFLGALAVAILVGLKLFRIRPLPPKVERQVIPIASIIPVAGILIESVNSVYNFLTVGGSIALAYISATTYWRKHIPEFAMKPLGETAATEKGDAPPPA